MVGLVSSGVDYYVMCITMTQLTSIPCVSYSLTCHLNCPVLKREDGEFINKPTNVAESLDYHYYYNYHHRHHHYNHCWLHYHEA